MKKIILMFVAVAGLMALVACGGKKEGEKSEESAASKVATGVVPDGFSTSECKDFSISYPNAMKETFKTDECVNAAAEDGSIKFDATFNTNGPTIDQLPEYANNMLGLLQGKKNDEPVVDGKVMTIKSTKDGEVTLSYCVLKEDKVGLAGKIEFKESAENEACAQQILNSIKFK